MGPAPDRRFLLLSNHGHALVAIADDPNMRMREIADRLGVTERAAHSILNDLVRAGFVTRTRVGRRNTYTVDETRPLLHPALDQSPVGALLASVVPPRPDREDAARSDPVLGCLANLAAGLLRAPVCIVAVLTPSEEVIAAAHGAPQLLGGRRPVEEALCRPVLESAGPLVVESAGRAPALEAAHLRDLGFSAVAGVILAGPGGRPAGALTAADQGPRRWSSEDVRALSLLAEAAGPRLRYMQM
jgi:GAF domain-containing protein